MTLRFGLVRLHRVSVFKYGYRLHAEMWTPLSAIQLQSTYVPVIVIVLFSSSANETEKRKQMR